MPLPLRRLLQLVSIVRKIRIRYLIAGVFLSAASYAQVGGPGTVIVGGGGGASVDTSAFVLIAGDADGQTIQGRTGENQARMEIAVGSSSTVDLCGAGLSHGTVSADNEGAYLYSADSGSYIYSIDSEGAVIASSLAIRLISGQTPPTNANDTCTAGDTIDTATFHYYCHATDSWVRAPMAAW